METLVNAQDKTFEQIQNEMDFNGHAHFNLANYQAKNNLPCFISENSEDLSDVESWQSMFMEVLKTVKTKEFILAVCEKYDKEDLIEIIENTNEKAINFLSFYINVTNSTPKEFAEKFMDNYFLGGDDVWCSIHTKLADYTM